MGRKLKRYYCFEDGVVKEDVDDTEVVVAAAADVARREVGDNFGLKGSEADTGAESGELQLIFNLGVGRGRNNMS